MKKKRPPQFVSAKDEPPDDVKEALEIVEGIGDVVERVTQRRISDDGAAFLEDILDKARSIGATIEEQNRVSDRQLNALKNMLAGVKKWDHGNKD
jgi:hypothetical protein